MKKTLFLLAIISGISAGNASVFTVSNNTALPGSPGQYTTVSAAISAAANGDTILIQPSPTAYSGFTVNKGLVFIGSGYNPQTTNGLISNISSQITFNDGSSNSKLIGLQIHSITWANSFL